MKLATIAKKLDVQLLGGICGFQLRATHAPTRQSRRLRRSVRSAQHDDSRRRSRALSPRKARYTLNMTTLWLYLQALWRHWWSLMGCAAFTFLGIYAAATSQTPAWAVRASFALSAILFFVASYQAWKQERESLTDELSKNQQPDIRGEAYDFGFDEKRIATQIVDEVKHKSLVGFVFKLDLHNHHNVTTNLVAVELDGGGLPEPVVFSNLEYPQGILLEYAQSITIKVAGRAEATYVPGDLKFISLDNLKIYIIDGLRGRHEIHTRQGEQLTHYF